ncbi:MAG: Fe-S cluster assembly protein SufD [Acidimicrobiia bacterium]
MAAPWLRARRLAAFDIYDGLGMPTEREEIWRYVDLDFDLATFALPTPSPERVGDRAPSLGPLPATSGTAVVVDGAVIEAASSGAEVEVRSLAGAIEENPDRIEQIHGASIPADQDVFTAAHHAFATDAAVVTVPRGRAAPAPVHVVVEAVTDGGVTFPYLLVDVEDGAQASVVVEYRSPAATGALVAPHVEAFTGANAHLGLTLIQNWGYATTSLSQCRVVVGRDSTVRLAEAGLGGSLARLHLTVDLEGSGGSAEVLGAYLGEERQTLDYRYFMHHAGVGTRSDMFLKGAVEDEALSVFTGLIRIDEDAQRTNAFQTNRNLILSDGAAAQSVPNLEILANDVRCGHGSTVGPLDDEQRYYLMSRGLDRSQADRLQVRGFFEEVLARFPEQDVAEPVRRWINAKYVQAQEAGRV